MALKLGGGAVMTVSAAALAAAAAAAAAAGDPGRGARLRRRRLAGLPRPPRPHPRQGVRVLSPFLPPSLSLSLYTPGLLGPVVHEVGSTRFYNYYIFIIII